MDAGLSWAEGKISSDLETGVAAEPRCWNLGEGGVVEVLAKTANMGRKGKKRATKGLKQWFLKALKIFGFYG